MVHTHHFWANPSMWLKWRYHIIASNIGNNSHYIISLHNWFRPFYVLYFYTTVFWMNEWMPLCAHPQLWKDDKLDLPTQSMKHMTNTNSSSRLVLLYENTKYTYIYVWGKSIYIYIYNLQFYVMCMCLCIPICGKEMCPTNFSSKILNMFPHQLYGTCRM